MLALRKEGANLELSCFVAALAVQAAQSDHVVHDGLRLRPMGVATVLGDTAWYGVETGQRLTIKRVEGVSVAL